MTRVMRARAVLFVLPLGVFGQIAGVSREFHKTSLGRYEHIPVYRLCFFFLLRNLEYMIESDPARGSDEGFVVI